MDNTDVVKTGCLEVERITLHNDTATKALICVCSGGEDDGSAAEEIASRTAQTIFKVSCCLSPGVVYPTPFMDLVKVWKSLMRGGVDYRKSTMIGKKTGASLILSLTQWCRDHGIPLPSSLVLDSPFIGNNSYDNRIKTYLLTADSDDPYAYPLLGDYFLFPPVCLFDEDGSLVPLKNKLMEEKIKYEYSKNLTRGEYISTASSFIAENMY